MAHHQYVINVNDLLSFDSLTASQLAKLNTIIYSYISRSRYNTDPLSANCNPKRLVCGLSRRAGGAGAPALELFPTALAAKRAFRLFQPQPALWKSIHGFQLMRTPASSIILGCPGVFVPALHVTHR
jgi:hypothetical protein